MYSSVLSVNWQSNRIESKSKPVDSVKPMAVIISENTVQIQHWTIAGQRHGLQIVGSPTVEAFLNSDISSNPSLVIFVEIGFGEMLRAHPAVTQLLKLGYDAAIPVSENSLPEEAIKFARSLYKWQNLFF